MAHPAFERLDHRPWPCPAGPWAWRQAWCDLLFAHWPVPAKLLRPLVPEPLQVQEFEGTSWIGIVPFRMEGVMLRPLPDMPWVSAFAELNVRLYVEYEGKPGVWFLSLDAANPLAVWAARRFFHLPYFLAKMRIQETPDGFDYESRRVNGGHRFEGRYRPVNSIYESKPGTLEHWLTERYCLYAVSPAGKLFRADVHHVPWPLQRAELELGSHDLAEAFGLKLSGEPATLHFARRLEVVVWNPAPVRSGPLEAAPQSSREHNALTKL